MHILYARQACSTPKGTRMKYPYHPESLPARTSLRAGAACTETLLNPVYMKYNCGKVKCDFRTDTSWKCTAKPGVTRSGEGYAAMLAEAEILNN